MNKSEYTREQVERYLCTRGQVKINDLIARVHSLTADDDPRWIGVAVSHFDNTGQLRHVTCDPNHYHNSECAVEWVVS